MKRLLPRCSALAILIAGLLVTAAPSSAHPSIDIVASKGKLVPSTITLHVGERRELRLITNGGDYTVESKQLGVPLTTIKPTGWIRINVTPKKIGVYGLHCACGAGHENVILTVKVVP
ncbi:MAG: cupredoxin domain-containing protein [Vulcanimicrobiaceae bacterium]